MALPKATKKAKKKSAKSGLAAGEEKYETSLVKGIHQCCLPQAKAKLNDKYLVKALNTLALPMPVCKG